MKYLVFDFDGTIVDNLPLVIDLLKHELLQKNVDLNQYPVENLRQAGVREFMKQIRISKLELLLIYKNIKKAIRQHFLDYPPVAGLEAVLPFLATKYELLIFSSNHSENIKKYLEKYQLQPYFSEVFEDDSYFGKHQGLKKIIKRYQVKSEDVAYVGDETRDIDAGKKAGVKTIAVAWGYEGERPLSGAKPDLLLANPADLLTINF